MALTIYPKNTLSLAQEALRNSLADADAFRDWAGVTSRAAALARIHHEALPDPSDGEAYTLAELRNHRPYAVIATAEQQGFTRRAISTSGQNHDFGEGGVLRVILAQTVDSTLSYSQAELSFRNAVGGIIDDLCGLSGTTGADVHLAIREVRLALGIGRSHPKHAPKQDDEHNAMLEVTWGTHA